MVFQGRLEIRVAHGLNHVRKGLRDRVLCKIDVLKGVLERIGEGLHRISPEKGAATAEHPTSRLVPITPTALS